MSDKYYAETQILRISSEADGEFEVHEIKDESSIPPNESDLRRAGGNRHEFHVPAVVPGLTVVGYIDLDQKEIGVYPAYAGVAIGDGFKAGLDSGVTINLNLGLIRGHLKFYKRNNQLVFDYKVTVGIPPLAQTFENIIKVIDWPTK